MVGLLVGKTAGIALATWLALKNGIVQLPRDMGMHQGRYRPNWPVRTLTPAAILAADVPKSHDILSILLIFKDRYRWHGSRLYVGASTDNEEIGHAQDHA